MADNPYVGRSEYGAGTKKASGGDIGSVEGAGWGTSARTHSPYPAANATVQEALNLTDDAMAKLRIINGAMMFPELITTADNLIKATRVMGRIKVIPGTNLVNVGEGDTIHMNDVIGFIASAQGQKYLQAAPEWQVDRLFGTVGGSRYMEGADYYHPQVGYVYKYPYLKSLLYPKMSEYGEAPSIEHPIGVEPGRRGGGGGYKGQYTPRQTGAGGTSRAAGGTEQTLQQMSSDAIRSIFMEALPKVPNQRAYFEDMLTPILSKFRYSLEKTPTGEPKGAQKPSAQYDWASHWAEGTVEGQEKSWSTFLEQYQWGKEWADLSPYQRGEYTGRYAPAARWVNY